MNARTLRWAIPICLLYCGAAEATLLDRGPDMVYDDVLDITWTRQAGDGVTRNWNDAHAWAASLVVGGYDDWRLPWLSVSAGVGPASSTYSCSGAGGADEVACRDNELGYMFYYNLGGQPGVDKTGTQTAIGGQVLTGIQYIYMSGTEFIYVSGPTPPGNLVWYLRFDDGGSPNGASKSDPLYTWAVRDGDVVPEPSTFALVALGLGGLGLSGRRRARA